MNPTENLSDFSVLERKWRLRQLRKRVIALSAIALIGSAFAFADGFDAGRYSNLAATIVRLSVDSWPPDFSRWRAWGRPLLETLAMGVAGTALGGALALPLSALAARNVALSPWISQVIRLALNMVRSLPGLIWGVIFVAAVGFGPLPGVLALGVHSTGMLGKLFFEAMEHVDPAPGAVLRANGASPVAIFRFAILPQSLPRIMDALIYRLEHNLRAATTLGLVGAGGFGLEIVTAFHLFEYREASALLIVVLALVTAVNLLGAAQRRALLSMG